MTWVLYGATGFTGGLLAEEAVKRGHRPVLAARSEERLRPLAERLSLPWRAVALDDARGLRALLEGHAAVLHAAGPFAHTSRPMADACLDTGAHYLDITGELEVFEALYARDAEARARGVALLPGAGFDVVPSDCLAAFLAGRVKAPRRLDLALAVLGRPSRGTAKSMVGVFGAGGRVRRGGVLASQPLGEGVHRVRFSSREAWVLPVPLGDLLSAGLSTGIPDITTSVAIPRRVARLARAAAPVVRLTAPLLGVAMRSAPLRGGAERLIGRLVPPPRPAAEPRNMAWLHGVVEGSGGERVEAWLETTEGYFLTAQTGVRLVELVLQASPRGAVTPSMVGGADFILQFEGCRRMEHLPAGG